MNDRGKIFRVCLTGSECTGKTTLAKALAEELNCFSVPEYSREYALARGGVLSADDVEPIARGQLAAEDCALGRIGTLIQPRRSSLLILDTDLISTVVYARHYYGGCPNWIEHMAKARKADLYFLCGLDVGWRADGIRDQPECREIIQTAFAHTLRTLETHFFELKGSIEERLAKALESIQSVMQTF